VPDRPKKALGEEGTRPIASPGLIVKAFREAMRLLHNAGSGASCLGAVPEDIYDQLQATTDEYHMDRAVYLDVTPDQLSNEQLLEQDHYHYSH